MSDEPKKRSIASRITGSRILMGVVAGIFMALLNPPSWKFWLECVAVGALFGFVADIVNWLLTSRNSRANR
jgi:hypothetical protein